MHESRSLSAPSGQPRTTGESPLYRSGAVARMLHMPVATLRVWERRYQLTQPSLSPSGQRLYSAADVRRLALLKQLTDLGHAIGSLAPLDMKELQRVAATHAAASTSGIKPPETTPATPMPAWRVAVIGVALGQRLQRPALLRRLGRPVALLGPFDDVEQAVTTLGRSDVDTLLFHAAHLHEGWLVGVDAAAPAFADVPKAVLYGFAPDLACETLATAGIALLREPQPDAVVAQWLLGQAMTATAAQPAAGKATLSTEAVPPPRWNDAALADFAGRSSTIACECPRHVAELLMQMSHFESYSTECAQRNPADAEMHGYLQRTAAAARARFEAALEQVALHEGMLLPASPKPNESPWAADARRRKAALPSTSRQRQPEAASGKPASDGA